MSNLPDAIRGAVEEFCHAVVILGKGDRILLADIISRHIAPVVKAVEAERDKLREHHSFYESIQRSQQSHQSLCWRVANAAIKSRVVYNFGACGGGEPSFGAIVAKIEEAVASCEKVATERDVALSRAEAAEALLRELVAIVRGECPQILDEDSGGNAKLDLAIAAHLSSPKRPRE